MEPKFSIVEQHAITSALGKAYSVFERSDDAFLSLCFALERDPKSAGFALEDRPGIYFIMIPGKPSISFPKITALYEVKKDQIIIHSIRIEHGGVIFHSAAFENRLGKEALA